MRGEVGVLVFTEFTLILFLYIFRVKTAAPVFGQNLSEKAIVPAEKVEIKFSKIEHFKKKVFRQI